MKKVKSTTIMVQHDNIEKAIKRFRRSVIENNILTDYYKHRFFIKESIIKKKKENLKLFKIKIWQKEQEQKRID